MQPRAFAKSQIPQWVAQGDILRLLNLTAAGYQEFKHFLRTSAVTITVLCLLSSESCWKSCLKNKASNWYFKVVQNPHACTVFILEKKNQTQLISRHINYRKLNILVRNSNTVTVMPHGFYSHKIKWPCRRSPSSLMLCECDASVIQSK